MASTDESWPPPPPGAAPRPVIGRAALAALASLTLALGGCGGDDEDKGASGDGTSTRPAGASPTSERSGTAGAKQDLSRKPKVDVPDGSPPKKLAIDDLVSGKGRRAKAGDTVSVQYVGVLFRNGKQFDASWDRGEPFQFELGAGMVIPGWDRGVAGMRVGGRRRLTIPPELAYGDQGAGADIGPGETLVFVVDLIEIS